MNVQRVIIKGLNLHFSLYATGEYCTKAFAKYPLFLFKDSRRWMMEDM